MVQAQNWTVKASIIIPIIHLLHYYITNSSIATNLINLLVQNQKRKQARKREGEERGAKSMGRGSDGGRLEMAPSAEKVVERFAEQLGAANVGG